MKRAMVYETNLGDTDSAFVVMLAAFQESPATLDLATDLARMATFTIAAGPAGRMREGTARDRSRGQAC